VTGRVAVEEGRWSSGDGATLDYDVYRLESVQESQPLVVLLHGGGWATGSRDQLRGYALLAARDGLTCVTPSYRLTTTAPWPTQLADVVGVTAHLVERADELGVDPGRLALWGNSAGAHLALLAAYGAAPHLLGADAPSMPPVRAVVAFYPPTRLVPGGPPQEFLPRLLDPGDDAAHRWASPLHWVSPASPPTLLFHGARDVDVLVSNSTELHDRLCSAGVRSELHLYGDQGHGYDVDRSFGREASAVAAAFLSRAWT
jgi:acetyl esterase/lipase